MHGATVVLIAAAAAAFAVIAPLAFLVGAAAGAVFVLLGDLRRVVALIVPRAVRNLPAAACRTHEVNAGIGVQPFAATGARAVFFHVGFRRVVVIGGRIRLQEPRRVAGARNLGRHATRTAFVMRTIARGHARAAVIAGIRVAVGMVRAPHAASTAPLDIAL
jgi:hypothetical protein